MSLARATTAEIWSPRPPATVRRPSSRRIPRAPVPRAAAEERAASVVPALEDATRDAVPLADDTVPLADEQSGRRRRPSLFDLCVA